MAATPIPATIRRPGWRSPVPVTMATTAMARAAPARAKTMYRGMVAAPKKAMPMTTAAGQVWTPRFVDER